MQVSAFFAKVLSYLSKKFSTQRLCGSDEAASVLALLIKISNYLIVSTLELSSYFSKSLTILTIVFTSQPQHINSNQILI